MTRLSWILLAAACAPKLPAGPVPVVQAAEPVRLIVEADDASPNLYLQAMVAAGSSWDRPGQEGIAHLTAQALVDAGAGELDANALREALYVTGNGFSVVVDKEWVSLRLRCHRDHADLCVERFADVLTAPRFDANDVIRLREEAAHAVSDGLLGDDEALGEAVFHSVLYEGHPYAHPVEGRAGVLPTLDAADLAAFHQAHYVRGSVVVGLAGAVPEGLEAQLAERLLALPSTPVPDRVEMAPPPVPGGGLTIVRTSSPVTGFHLGHPIATDRNDPDWPALYVAMTAFGAHRQSFGQLFQAVRATRGLNYGAYAYVEPYVQQGWSSSPENGVLRPHNHFYLWLRPTSVDNGPFMAKLAVHELRRFVDEGLDDEAFADVVSYLRGALPLLATDPGRRLAFALEAEISQTPHAVDHLLASLDDLTPDDVRAALARHVRPDELTWVAVSGDPEGLRDQLLGDAPTTIRYADVTPDEAQAAVDAEVAAAATGLDPDRVVITEAEGVFR